MAFRLSPGPLRLGQAAHWTAMAHRHPIPGRPPGPPSDYRIRMIDENLIIEAYRTARVRSFSESIFRNEYLKFDQLKVIALEGDI